MTDRENLPKSFFNAIDFTEALMYIRRCFLYELESKEMFRELLEHYKKCTDSAQKKALLKLMVAIEEFEKPTAAREKALQHKLLDPDNAHEDRSCGCLWLKEQILKEGYLMWLEDYNDDYQDKCEFSHSFDDPRYWMVVPPKERKNVITICKKADVYCVIEKDLSINFVVMDNHYGEYHVDEFGKLYNPPTYVSATIETDLPDFISPVYKAKVAKRVLEYCLARIGFPYITIKLKVIYTSPSIELVNMKFFIPGKFPQYSTSKEWIGVYVSFVKDIVPNQGFMLHCPYNDPIDTARDIDERVILRVLMDSLYATSKIYEYMYDYPESYFMFSYRWHIEEYAQKLGVFQNDK